MIVFRHVEDIAWKRDDSQTEEGLDNFDAIDDRQRTCEIRVSTHTCSYPLVESCEELLLVPVRSTLC